MLEDKPSCRPRSLVWLNIPLGMRRWRPEPQTMDLLQPYQAVVVWCVSVRLQLAWWEDTRYEPFASGSYTYGWCSPLFTPFVIVLSVLFPWHLKLAPRYREKRNALQTGTLPAKARAHRRSAGVDTVSRMGNRPGGAIRSRQESPVMRGDRAFLMFG